MSAKVSAALEDYLEAIFKLQELKGAARVRDIARRLSVHKSTVTSALHALGEKGFIEYSPYEMARLTPDGQRIAEQVARRHGQIKRFLTDVLLLDEETAAQNACRMEHVVDRDVISRLVRLADFLHGETAPRTRWKRALRAATGDGR